MPRNFFRRNVNKELQLYLLCLMYSAIHVEFLDNPLGYIKPLNRSSVVWKSTVIFSVLHETRISLTTSSAKKYSENYCLEYIQHIWNSNVKYNYANSYLCKCIHLNKIILRYGRICEYFVFYR